MILPQDLRQVLLETFAGGCIMLKSDCTPAFVARLPLGFDVFKNAPVRVSELGVFTYQPEGTIFRIEVELLMGDSDVIWFEVFFDPTSLSDREILIALVEHELVRLHIFGCDENLSYVGTKQLPWFPSHRQGIAIALAQPIRTPVQFLAAKERYIRENPQNEF